MAWAQGQERPRRLRLLNGTDGPVSVWLDNCLDHFRLGDVPAGKRWALELPDRLVPYSDQLHVHVVDLDGRMRVGSYAVDLEKKWALSLDVGERTGESLEGADEGAADRFEGLNGFLVIPGGDLTTAVRWAEDTPATLTWQCLRGEPSLTLTHSGREEGGVVVEVKYRGSDEPTSGTWAVYQGRAKGVRAPREVAEEVTRRALEASALEVTVGQGEGAQRHTFSLNGILVARQSLSCFGPG